MDSIHVSGSGPWHFRTEGAVARRGPRRGCRCHRTARERPPVPGLVRAGSRRLDRRVLTGAGRTLRAPRLGAGDRHRRAHARCGAAGRSRGGGATLPALERHPGRCRSCGHGRRPGLPRHLRHHRLSRLFRTQASLGPGSRAGALGPDGTGPVPQGLPRPLAHWHAELRALGRSRLGAVRPRQGRLEPGPVRGGGAVPRPAAPGHQQRQPARVSTHGNRRALRPRPGLRGCWRGGR
ncbi:MAG: Uncharacterised protein [Rhodospirillaceae bacterium]|nr:MAG: Uncharacterised protein [Rhodospirillaceae bacterium]